MSRVCFISARAATLVLALGGLAVNAFAALHLFRLWRSLRWEPESEWEGSERYTLAVLRSIWCLLAAYFSVAAIACVVGLLGVVRRVPSYVRLYRDYSVTDLCASALATLAFAAASFRPAVRAALCEELSHQPDLLRDLTESGLSIENCEPWLERAVLVSVALMAVVLVVRLQFTLTISSYYTQLLRAKVPPLRLHVVRPPPSTPAPAPVPQRIFLLPSLVTHARAAEHTPPLVYAPVPLAALSEADARELDATEAWVASPPPSSPLRQNQNPHQYRAHRRSGSGAGLGLGIGRISLPVRPGEPLLPQYDVKH